ncbi:MAG: 2-(3-amino-3-carboxypropyl)histidine synthase [Candidatus Heimdallarchaeota archaeon LC_3]|nr:MAG: 2-(3-amino-3-carboxypropyl)histidine synthase [Candidatus Heimdallarchaeota archaeon LC_3]
MTYYNIDFSLLDKTIKNFRIKPQKILLQFPDGLLGSPLQSVVNFLIERDIEPVLSADPSYGACDLPLNQAKMMGIDHIFHFGHSTFAFPPPSEFKGKISYFPVKVNIEFSWNKILEEIIILGWKTVGLLTTIQHVDKYKFENETINNSNITFVQHKEGQILGCNQDRATKIASSVDGFLVIAGGDFHASPIVVATNRPTLRYDPFNETFKLFDEQFRNKYLSKRYALIEKAKKATNWGVILSAKSGQFPKDKGSRILNMLKRKGLTAIPFIMHNVNLPHLSNFETIDAWIITLCPRLATDDYIRIKKPILTSRELAVVLGDLSWDQFITPKTGEHLLTIEEFE